MRICRNWDREENTSWSLGGGVAAENLLWAGGRNDLWAADETDNFDPGAEMTLALATRDERPSSRERSTGVKKPAKRQKYSVT